MPIQNRSFKASSPNVKIQDVPNTPIVGSATQDGSVSFSPASTGGRAYQYRVISSPGNLETVGFSSPITVDGLTAATSYTFQVRGETNAGATSDYSSSSNSAVVYPHAMELISSTLLTSDRSGVLSFLNIPQGYKHLQIRAVIRSTYNGAENFYMRFNGQTYTMSGHALNGNASVAGSFNYSNNNYADMIAIASAANSPGIYSTFIIDILEYSSSTKNKTIRGFGGFVSGSNQAVQLRSNLVLTTTPISSITEMGGTSGTGILSGSRVSLYGVRG